MFNYAFINTWGASNRRFFLFAVTSRQGGLHVFFQIAKMSDPHSGRHVSKPAYMQACDLLYTDPLNPGSRISGPDRQKHQKMKHANDFRQIGPNPSYDPTDQSQKAIEDMKKFANITFGELTRNKNESHYDCMQAQK